MRRKEGKIIQNVSIRTSTHLLKVPLRLVKGDLNERRKGVDTFTYHIDIDHPAKVHVSDKDPEECVRKAQVVLEAALSIQWKDYLLVEVEGSEVLDGYENEDMKDRAQLVIRYKCVQTGLRAGEPVWRHVREWVDERTRPPQVTRRPADWIEEGSPLTEKPQRGQTTDTRYGLSEVTQSDIHSEALIDDTAFNRERLQGFIAGLHALRAQVKELLSPKNIELTLTSASPLLLGSPLADADEAPRTIEVKGIRVVKKADRKRRRT